MTDAAGQRLPPPIDLPRLRLQCERLLSFCSAARGILDRWPGSSAAEENAALALTLRVVQTLEMVKSVDSVSRGQLYPLLTEIPMQAPPDQLSWSNLIRMRDLMTHRPWNVDDQIVRDTVANDFPVLQQLFANARFHIRTVDPNDHQTLDDVRSQIRTPHQIIIYQTADHRLITMRQTPERR